MRMKTKFFVTENGPMASHFHLDAGVRDHRGEHCPQLVLLPPHHEVAQVPQAGLPVHDCRG